MVINIILLFILIVVSVKLLAVVFCLISDWKNPVCPLCYHNFYTTNSFKRGPFCKKHGFLFVKFADNLN